MNNDIPNIYKVPSLSSFHDIGTDSQCKNHHHETSINHSYWNINDDPSSSEIPLGDSKSSEVLLLADPSSSETPPVPVGALKENGLKQSNNTHRVLQHMQQWCTHAVKIILYKHSKIIVFLFGMCINFMIIIYCMYTIQYERDKIHILLYDIINERSKCISPDSYGLNYIGLKSRIQMFLTNIHK